MELLEYLAPRDGRPMPADERANDLIHWQTALVAPELESAWRSLKGPAPVAMPDGRSALLLHDPDGHALVLGSK